MSPSWGILVMRLISEYRRGLDAFQCHLLALRISENGSQRNDFAGFGQARLCRSAEALVRSLGIGVGIGLLFFILQRWIIGCGLWAMSPEADVVELARRYCYVCIWGAPAVLGLYGFTGWFIGMQNTRIPMVVSLTQNVVNIVASWCSFSFSG